MLIRQLFEAREAPLYHFTSEAGLFNILRTDTLVSGGAKLRSGGTDPEGRIYFTRDYSRQFLPANILSGSWGLRVDQGRLHQKYGRALVAGGQGKHAAWSEKDRQAWLADPKNADEIARVKAGATGTSRHNGADTRDIVAGTIGKSQRWESEEHLNVGSVPNIHEYITGIVYAGGKSLDPHRSGKDFKKRSADPQSSLDELAENLMGHFTGQAGWAQRDSLIEYMTKFNIPFVYQRQDFPAKAVKDRMIAIWRERKAEKTRRAESDNTSWIAVRNPQGGGVAVNGPSNIWSAAQQVLKDMPGKFPDGIFGMKGPDGKTQWFTSPYTDPSLLPNVPMGTLGDPPQVKQPAN